MFSKIRFQFKKKSLKERFLLVIGILLFLTYFVLGMFIVFGKQIPLQMKPSYRIAFGILLIVYSFIRFIRILNTKDEQ